MRASCTALVIALSFGVAARAQDVVRVIHVDEKCRVFTEDRAGVHGSYSRPRFRADRNLCKAAGVHTSRHWEQNVQQGIVQRTLVKVQEREFLLHDALAEPVTFRVEQSLPAGWRVDSIPQPVEVENSVAVFAVRAEPGQIVRLHIGIRR